MGIRFIGALVIVSAITLALSAGQNRLLAQQRAPQPAAATPQRGAQPAQPGQPVRPARIGGHPNFNGVWQAINSANWNLEAHSVSGLSQFWQLGAIASIPAGKSMIKGGGTIPYKPEALKQRDENRAKWPESDNEAKCYMLGIPRYTYHIVPFQIFQGDGDIQMVYPFAAGNRIVHMKDKATHMKEKEKGTDRDPVDSWMGKSNGYWDGDVLVVDVTDLLPDTMLDRAGNFHSNQLKVTERFRLIDPTHIEYEATLDDPETYTRPWTIAMPLYRLIDDNVQSLEYKCVPFADMLLYHDLIGDKPRP
jgi:hypothetical protein